LIQLSDQRALFNYTTLLNRQIFIAETCQNLPVKTANF
jgi:hypothetical protein